MPPIWSDSVEGLRLRLVGETGSMLIEVMIGALVLAVATAAVLNGVDTAQQTGAANKQRSVAATLAQQDIERMRSMPVTALANFHQTRSVDVSGVRYTVVSDTDWVRDASGVVSCSDDSTQAEYIRLSSTVNSPSGADRPVTERSLLTPAPGSLSETAGTSTVRLVNRDAAPLPGVSVQLTGPRSLSDTTNENGCAVFAYIPSGDYTATVGGNLVSWRSELPATTTLTVAAGKTGLTQLEVDKPGSLRAQFHWPSDVPPDWTLTAPGWPKISVAHAKLPGGVKLFDAPDAEHLFPHRDGYGVYAGTCAANNPAFWDSNYFRPDGPGYVQLDPGDFLKTVDVELATLRVTLVGASGTATVAVKQDDNPNSEVNCTEVVAPETRGQRFDLQLPLGHYRVCAKDGGGAVARTVDLTAPEHLDIAMQVVAGSGC